MGVNLAGVNVAALVYSEFQFFTFNSFNIHDRIQFYFQIHIQIPYGRGTARAITPGTRGDGTRPGPGRVSGAEDATGLFIYTYSPIKAVNDPLVS